MRLLLSFLLVLVLVTRCHARSLEYDSAPAEYGAVAYNVKRELNGKVELLGTTKSLSFPIPDDKTEGAFFYTFTNDIGEESLPSDKVSKADPRSYKPGGPRLVETTKETITKETTVTTELVK